MNMAMRDDRMLSAALAYAQRGWFIFPLQAGTKGSVEDGRSSHLLDRGHKAASSDPEQIRAWWQKWPDANIGLNLSRSGLVAIDIDAYKAECTWDSYTKDRVVPRTLRQRSARGGRHLLFRAKAGTRYPGKLCSGVDIKHNGYILVEPSTFDGGPYSWEIHCDPAAAPDWLNAAPLDIEPRNNLAFETVSFNQRTSSREVEDLLAFIDPDNGGYDAWVEVLQGLHDHFSGSAEGLSLADAWSRRGAKYRVGDVEAKWRGFTAGGGITLSSVARRAREGGADLSAIARRYAGGGDSHGPVSATAGRPVVPDDRPDLSHDHLAVDLGIRSWDANARHVALWGKWLFWQGTHWRADETLDHMSRTRTYLRQRAQELVDWAERKVLEPDLATDPAAAKKLLTWARDNARSLRSHPTVNSVSNLARANRASAVTHEAFDTKHYLLSTPGGTVDLRTGNLRSSRREDMISRLANCAPAPPGTQAPLWTGFLMEIFEGDVDTIAFLQRAAGYALTGCTNEHKLLFLHGAGRNGKSVFLNTLLEIWGDYGRRVSATTFLNSQTERHPTDIANLQGARLAIASELPRGKTWDEATIKDLTGGDRLTARYMRQDFFEFTPQLTLMIAGNTQPSFRGVDEAIRSRVVLVPFAVTIPAEKRDRTLPDKLRAEAPAILRWCIDGALAWQDRGLDVPPAIAAASKAYFDEEDTVGQFLQDETCLEQDGFVASEDLIVRFNYWADRQGLAAWSQRTLIKELRQRGFQDGRSNRQRGLRGLRLK